MLEIFVTIIGILVAYLIPSGIIMMFPKKTRILGKAQLTGGLFIAALTIIILTIRYYSPKEPIWQGRNVLWYNTSIIATIIGSVLVFAVITLTLFGFYKKLKIYIPVLAVFAVFIVSLVCIKQYCDYIDSIPEVDDRSQRKILESYSTNSEKLARLDKQASLKFESDAPKMDGATALYPIYSAFANEVYPSTASDKVLCTGTTVAYEKIVDGSADVIFAAAPSKKQLEYAKEKGVELELTPIGYEAFVFFVNSKNPIDEVSLEDIKEIYSGKITKWNELGVSGFGKIRAFQREEGSGSQSALLRLMEGRELMTPPKEDVVWGMGEIIKQTANYKNFKNALGFSFRFYSTEMVKNSQIKLLEINGVAPTRENIENGTYPITSNFYAVTRKGDTSENTQKLIDWILSSEGKEIIDKTGYTPIK